VTKKYALAYVASMGALVGLAWSSAAVGDPINIVNPYHYLDNRSANSINITPGLFQTFGATSVTPNGANGTTGTATQGTFVNLPLNFTPFDTLPNHFVRSLPANVAPNGQWILNFSNGLDTASTNTPGGIGSASLIGFATGMSISGAGNAPTFSWTAPATPFDTQRVVIRDTTDLRGTGGVGGNGVANIIYSQDIGPSATSFAVNPLDPNFTQHLTSGHLYSFELNVRDLRNNLGGTGLANTLSQSRTFFDFMLLPTGSPANVYLPLTDATNPQAPFYQFQGISVKAGQQVFLDPLVAIGYDFQIGAGDPNFASVLLPTGIGDNLYQLLLWNSATSTYEVTTTLTGGLSYLFGGSGVDRFRILGIETSAGLDPFNSLAFIAGLTFTDDGTFSGTMTPITEFVAQTPLPAALPLFVTGLGMIGALGWRRRRRPVSASS
jgi:hypothetical protein